MTEAAPAADTPRPLTKERLLNELQRRQTEMAAILVEFARLCEERRIIPREAVDYLCQMYPQTDKTNKPTTGDTPQ